MVLRGDCTHQLVALMIMSSRTSGKAGNSTLAASTPSVPEVARFDYVEATAVETGGMSKYTSISFCLPVTVEEPIGLISLIWLSSDSSMGVLSSGTATVLGTIWSRSDYLGAQCADVEAVNNFRQQARFHMATEAIKSFPAVREHFKRQVTFDKSQRN